MKKFLKVTSVITLLFFLRASFALAADQVYFYYTDPAGSPLAMSDSSGAVVWRADYLPFGEETINTSTVPNNKMFVGKEKDSESGLYYFGARYMDSAAGRFIASDPIRAVNAHTGETSQSILHNPQKLNLYAYSLNNPYRFIDPDGKSPFSLIDNEGVVDMGGGAIAAESAEAGALRAPAPSSVNSGAAISAVESEAVSAARGRVPGPTIDSRTGREVGRFVGDSKGNTMIEPVGGNTEKAGKYGENTRTTYPNGSNYQRLDPQGHDADPNPHGHGHLEGDGRGQKGQGPSLSPTGTVVPRDSRDAHWQIY